MSGKSMLRAKLISSDVASSTCSNSTVSQFTLHGRTVKGTKPDFHRAMGGAQARQLYDELLRKLGDGYRSERVKDGAFGEMMQVSLSNDGPVTLTIDTADKRH